jgi:lipopolysaccharide/colanic/teichoic acid biosynthesis glycosyltransferase
VTKNWTGLANFLTANSGKTAAVGTFSSYTAAPARRISPLEQVQPACPIWKRCLDIGLLLLGLPIVLPVMLGVALVIKLVSKGPIFFKQERIGYLGKPFTCWKFRTMHVDANQETHRAHVQKLISSNQPLVKLDAKGDKRLIPFGRILRACCVDELPQLINVALGDMSLVGPRPCMGYEYSQFTSRQLHRFNSAPGMTGLWQMNRRSDTNFSQMMQMDLEYVNNRSLWLDMKILSLTVPSVIAQVRELRAARRAQALNPTRS